MTAAVAAAGTTVVAAADAAAAVVTAAALVVTAAVWLQTRAWNPAMPVLLDLLLAAGLLRLSASDGWPTIGVAAAVVAVRVMIRTGIGHTSPVEGGGHPSRSDAAVSARRTGEAHDAG